MKDNYIKSIYSKLNEHQHDDSEDLENFGENLPAKVDNSILADQNIEIEVEYLDGRDARIVSLTQGSNTIIIPEDKVDHYMSEIMGMLDAGFRPSQDSETNLDSIDWNDKRPDTDSWEDDLPQFN